MISEMRPSAFSCGDGAVRIAGELDAVGVHHERAADLQPAGKIERGAAIEDGAPGFRMAKGRASCRRRALDRGDQALRA